jgi:hypothetical protein
VATETETQAARPTERLGRFSDDARRVPNVEVGVDAKAAPAKSWEESLAVLSPMRPPTASAAARPTAAIRLTAVPIGQACPTSGASCQGRKSSNRIRGGHPRLGAVPARDYISNMPRSHPGVDAYIDALPAWQQELCTELRDIIWEADPEIEETIKRSVQPYFVLDGNVCAFLATKSHLNLFLYDPTVPDPDGIINQGHRNATARAIQMYRGGSVDKTSLIALLRAIVANNRAGGWRRLDKTRR